MRYLVASVAVAIGYATLLCAELADREVLQDVVASSNGLIEQANVLRRQAAAGEISADDARAGVAQLLPAFDAIDQQALRICRETMDEEALAEAADLLVHGPVLQSLYALTGEDKRFGGGIGYALLYERVLQLAEDDFRTENSLNDPEVIRGHFSDVRAVAVPWLDAEALAALREMGPARAALDGDQTVQERLSSLAAFASRAREVLTEYERTENPGLLAGYLQTRLELAQAYAKLLAQATGKLGWAAVGEKFGDLAAGALNEPEAMLAVFSDPEGPPEETEEEELLQRLFLNWWDIFGDVFNKPKPWMWRPDMREGRNVEIALDDGRLYIRGRSNPGPRWHRSGRVTRRWSGRSFVFTVDIGGAGTGYYRHMQVEGDNGSLVNLAFGGERADSIFEIHRGDQPPISYGRPAGDLPSKRRHQGRIEYREDKTQIWAYIDDVLIGHGSVDLGQRKSFAIYVSSGDEVEYDAWFDNFDVRPP
ncbi:MAG: hypothetical protein PVH68_12145 [Armatimonadota bacterium]|jgi:hypothetical protein